VNTYVTFKLQPDAVKIKQQVASFERESPDSPARRAFRRLHGISAGLNLLVLADGVALLVISPFLRK
jgi:EAL domain-containing protein (putative c-di-GMP-specific phosphodiesterase class I)